MEPKSDNAPEWDIDKTHPQYHDDLINGLSDITDPELGFSIIGLGLVRNISIENDEVKISMILTSPYCPYGPAMLEATRAKAEEILQKKITVEYLAQMWDPSMMQKGLMDSDWGMYS
ncbi:MAG: iron-sulfur cluster assembly protein [Anaerolineaceae bacterium]